MKLVLRHKINSMLKRWLTWVQNVKYQNPGIVGKSTLRFGEIQVSVMISQIVESTTSKRLQKGFSTDFNTLTQFMPLTQQFLRKAWMWKKIFCIRGIPKSSNLIKIGQPNNIEDHTIQSKIFSFSCKICFF